MNKLCNSFGKGFKVVSFNFKKQLTSEEIVDHIDWFLSLTEEEEKKAINEATKYFRERAETTRKKLVASFESGQED